MNKIIIALLAVVSLALSACGTSVPPVQGEQPPSEQPNTPNNPPAQPNACEPTISEFSATVSTGSIGTFTQIKWSASCYNAITLTDPTGKSIPPQNGLIGTEMINGVWVLVVAKEGKVARSELTMTVNRAELPRLDLASSSYLGGWYVEKGHTFIVPTTPNFPPLAYLVIGRYFNANGTEYYSVATMVEPEGRGMRPVVNCISPAPINIVSGNAMIPTGLERCVVLRIPRNNVTGSNFEPFTVAETGDVGCGNNVVIAMLKTNTGWNMTSQPYSTSMLFRLSQVGNTQPWFEYKSAGKTPDAWQISSGYSGLGDNQAGAAAVWMQWANACQGQIFRQ